MESSIMERIIQILETMTEKQLMLILAVVASMK